MTTITATIVTTTITTLPSLRAESRGGADPLRSSTDFSPGPMAIWARIQTVRPGLPLLTREWPLLEPPKTARRRNAHDEIDFDGCRGPVRVLAACGQCAKRGKRLKLQARRG